MRGPPNCAMPLTVIAGPATAVTNRAELMAPRELDAQLVQPAVAHRRDRLDRRRVHAVVKSVARSVVVRPPPMFDSEKFLNRR